MTSSVDVVIPCYRYGRFLPEAVASVLRQDGVDLRILIIDDASGDGSADVARDIASQDARIEVREHTSNLGHISTFNHGALGWAKADYTVILSADDALTAGSLRRATWLLNDNPGMSFAYGHAITWRGGDLPTPSTSRRPPVVHQSSAWIEACARTASNPVMSPTAVVRTAVQHQVGGHKHGFPHTHDLDMWLRLAGRGTVGYLPDDQGYWRRHPDQLSDEWEHTSSGAPDLRERLATFSQLPTDLEWMARRHLAGEALHRAARAYDRGTHDPQIEVALVATAVDAVGGVEHLAQWKALQIRRALGPAAAPCFQYFVLPAVARRARQAIRDRRRARTGIQ